jgi:hypothetical protein
MINKNNKYLGAALVTITVAGMVAAPQAMAKKAKKVQTSTVTEYHHSVTTTRSNTSALEAQLRVLQDEVASLKAQVKATAPTAAVVSADSQKIQELDAWAASVKADHGKHEQHEKHHEKDNLLYFRGGYAGNDQALAATTNTATLANGQIATLGTKGGTNGWNFGAGIDFNLNDNLFGLVDKTNLLGELDINYVDLGSFRAGAVSGVANAAGVPLSNAQQASQSMLRISASPKIKFLKGSAIRPWIIPVGFSLNVISPPSQANTITVLKPALNFGGGVDYNVWKSLYIGADVRYFLATSQLDGTNVNGLTAGGLVGFGF